MSTIRNWMMIVDTYLAHDMLSQRQKDMVLMMCIDINSDHWWMDWQYDILWSKELGEWEQVFGPTSQTIQGLLDGFWEDVEVIQSWVRGYIKSYHRILTREYRIALYKEYRAYS